MPDRSPRRGDGLPDGDLIIGSRCRLQGDSKLLTCLSLSWARQNGRGLYFSDWSFEGATETADVVMDVSAGHVEIRLGENNGLMTRGCSQVGGLRG